MSIPAQAANSGGMPVILLKEDKGRYVQKNDITAAKLPSEIVKSSLGPCRLVDLW
jgi:hypothetical protein